MNMDVSPIDQLARGRPPEDARPTPAAPKVNLQFAGALGSAVALDRGAVPSSPPPDVMRAVSAAAERMERLRMSNRELRFRIDDPSGRVQIEVRDLDGGLIRKIPPSEALDAMAGAALDHNPDRRR